MTRSPCYFPAIDYLRLVCAIGVVLFHVAYTATRGPELYVSQGIWFRYGWVGVQIFFVISGFVIAESAAKATPWSFLRRRAERLFPAVWICAPISAVVWIAYGRDFTKTLFLLMKSLALVPGGEWIDAPYWTLGVEIGFYAVVFVVLALAGPGRMRDLAVGMGLASALFWTVYALETFYGFRTGMGIFARLKPIPIYYGAYFALGMLIYFRKSGQMVRGSNFAIAACLAVAAAECSLIVTRSVTASVIPVLLFLLGIATIALARPSGSPPGGFARLCGLTTYPLYLLHFASGLALLKFLAGHGMPGFAAALVSSAVMIGLSIVIAMRLEPAVRRAMSRGMATIELPIERHAPGWLFKPRHVQDADPPASEPQPVKRAGAG
jgi:peptidoglycan/LPS O-acetylase OafA/YrhL